MHLHRRLLSFIAGVLAAVMMTSSVVAQDATPPALPATPEPAACTVDPRPATFYTDFGSRVATPAAPNGTPAEAAPAGVFQEPEGEPADEETVAGVTATVVQLEACLNANDNLRYFALFTDNYILREFAEAGALPQEEFEGLVATRQALSPQNQAAILAVVDVRVLENGRVAGLFDIYDPFQDPPGPARYYWEFVEQDGRWLIDEQITLGPVDPAQIGTPAA